NLLQNLEFFKPGPLLEDSSFKNISYIPPPKKLVHTLSTVMPPPPPRTMPPPPSRTMPPPPLKLMSSTPFSEAGHSISNPTKSTSDPVPGSQDTLLDFSGAHYFYQCYIQGSIDLSFCFFSQFFDIEGGLWNQECTLNSTATGSGAIAAPHKSSAVERTQVCSFCDLDGIINPSSWMDWGDPSRRGTVWLGEYKCKGRGADLRRQVPWAISFER
ncbi:hypothetical protein IFM89_008339, partial [Coptis chinensis]